MMGEESSVTEMQLLYGSTSALRDDAVHKNVLGGYFWGILSNKKELRFMSRNYQLNTFITW